MTDGYYIGLETLGQRFIGDPLGVLDDEAEEFEDLLVVGLVEIEAELLAT